MGKERLLLSICMITYNHAPYIRQAIEGVLMQKCNFQFELIIGEDNSADDTRQIVQTYATNFPEKIKFKPNITNFGAIPNFIKTLEECTGKYIALCEGDDYWTDPNKLQKQVDFLEGNPNFSFVFHNAEVLHRNKTRSIFCKNSGENYFSTKDFFNGKLQIPTHSVVFRKEFLDLPQWFNHVQQGDLALGLLLSLKGPIHYLEEIMGVYRKHETSLGATTSEVKSNLRKLELLSYFDIYTSFKFQSLILERKKSLTKKLYYQFLKETGSIKKYLNLDYYLFKYRQLLSKFR